MIVARLLFHLSVFPAHQHFIQFAPRFALRCSIYDLAFKPDGTQLIAAVGTRVLVSMLEVQLFRLLDPKREVVLDV